MKIASSLLLAAALSGATLGGCGDDAVVEGGPDGGDGGAVDTGAGGDSGGAGDSGRPDGGGRPDTGSPPPSMGCAPLAPSSGTEIRVTAEQADELPQIVRDAATGSVIVLEDGTYRMSSGDEGNRRLQFSNPGVTMRSASDDASRVILDGEYRTNEMIFIYASDITIAHITITRAVDHPIHVSPPAGGPNVSGTHLYALRIIDGGEQFIKANGNGDGGYVDDGVVECSYFSLTDAGRDNVEPNPGGCYTGGIDGHGVHGWVVRNNHFEDIYCDGSGLAEHAVHFWTGGRDNVVANNTIINCARGIGFGLGSDGAMRPYPDDPYPGVGYLGHIDGVIHGNVIYADIPFFDTGIELQQARGAQVFHNTIFSTEDATGFFSSIDYRFPNTDVDIRNNLTNRITMRDGASATVSNNVERASAAHFVNAAGRDFHLAESASDCIDQGADVPGLCLDIDGETFSRGAPDIGADER